MRYGGKTAGVLLGIAMLGVSTLQAHAGVVKSTQQHEFGQTLPPIGFVKFCISNPTECQPTGDAKAALEMSQEQWNLIHQVNTYVNGEIAPVSDMELYGEAEFWTFPTTAGDCEDYLLLKKRYLEGLGFPSNALLITVVLDEKREGHAVLTLATNEGDYILDNRHNEVLAWKQSNYTFLKRQSRDNPRQWISLANKKSATPDKLASK